MVLDSPLRIIHTRLAQNTNIYLWPWSHYQPTFLLSQTFHHTITWLRIVQKPHHLLFTNTGKPHFNYRFWSTRMLSPKDNLSHQLGGRGEQDFIRRLLGQPRRMKSCGLFYWCFNKVEVCTLGVSRAVRLQRNTYCQHYACAVSSKWEPPGQLLRCSTTSLCPVFGFKDEKSILHRPIYFILECSWFLTFSFLNRIQFKNALRLFGNTIHICGRH